MKDIKLAVIGAGVIGKRHLLASTELDNIKIVGIADPFPAAQSVADEYKAPLFTTAVEMLDAVKPDGVVIATPTEHHLEPTLQSLDAGAHVLVEKPIMADLGECEQTIAKSLATNRHVLVAHQRRYYSLVTKARDILKQGKIGKLVSVSGQWTMRKPLDYYSADWRKKWQAGPILTNLIHEMDLLRYIAGDIVSVTAETSNDVLNYEKEDAAGIIVRFENGALGTFMLSDQSHTPWSWEQAIGENAAFPRTGKNAIRFMGTEGSLDFPNLRLWTSTAGDSNWTNGLVAEDIPMEMEDAYVNQLQHFGQVIRGDELPRVSAIDATATLRATLAVYESAASGSRVTVSA